MNEAHERARVAKFRFDDLVRLIPSGIPAPDSSLLIKQASEEYQKALRAHSVALARWTDFVLKGIVPEDLEASRSGFSAHSAVAQASGSSSQFHAPAPIPNPESLTPRKRYD